MALVLTLGILVMNVTSSVAQEKTQDAAQRGPLNFIIEEENKEKIDFDQLFSKLPEDIQVDLAREAEQQYNRCASKGTFSKYYDCKCVAEKYLHARIMQGPETGKHNLLTDVVLECPYEEGIAGFQYQKCVKRFAMDVVFDLEAFCTCYANSIAKNFTEKPSMHSQYVNLLSNRAMTECGYHEDVMKYRKLQQQQDQIR